MMETGKKQISCFPNIILKIDRRRDRKLKAKIRNLYQDMEFLESIDIGKSSDNSLINRKKRKSSLLLNMNINKVKQKISLNETRKISYSKLQILNQMMKQKEEKSEIYLKSKNKKENKDVSLNDNKNKIKLIKLNFKKLPKNYHPNTSRYNVSKSFYKKKFFESKNNKNIESNSNSKSIFNSELLTSKKAHNNLNGSITMRTNNSNIYYLSKINKAKILNKTIQNLKQIFRRKSRDFIKEINSLEKISEQEKEKELSLKELFIKQNRKIFTKSKLFRNNSMMIKKRLKNVKFYEDFEKECRIAAITYRRGMGFFFRSNKTGLYTSHFSTLLRQDKFFPQDILTKIPQYIS